MTNPSKDALTTANTADQLALPFRDPAYKSPGTPPGAGPDTPAARFAVAEAGRLVAGVCEKPERGPGGEPVFHAGPPEGSEALSLLSIASYAHGSASGDGWRLALAARALASLAASEHITLKRLRRDVHPYDDPALVRAWCQSSPTRQQLAQEGGGDLAGQRLELFTVQKSVLAHTLSRCTCRGRWLWRRGFDGLFHTNFEYRRCYFSARVRKVGGHAFVLEVEAGYRSTTYTTRSKLTDPEDIKEREAAVIPDFCVRIVKDEERRRSR